MTGTDSFEPAAPEVMVEGNPEGGDQRVRPRRLRVPDGPWRRGVWASAVCVAVFAVPVVYAVDLSRADRPQPVSRWAALPDRVYPVPLYAPVVGPGSPLGQPAALLLGGVPRGRLLVGMACCSLAVVGASSDVSAYLELPGLTHTGGGWLARLSPDGRTVVYPAGAALRFVDLVDGTSRSITSPAGVDVMSVLGWSYDQSRVLVALARQPADGGGSRLAVVDVAGSRWTVLALPTSWTGSPRATGLSDDGTLVAFVTDQELWVEAVGGPAPKKPLAIGLDNPELVWAGDDLEFRVMSDSPTPRGSVAVGTRRELTNVYPDGSYCTATRSVRPSCSHTLGGTYDSVVPLTHFETAQVTDVVLVSRGRATTLERIDKGTLSMIAPLPSHLDPALVDVAAALSRALQTRHAGPPADPARTASHLAFAAGLIAALILTISTRPVRRLILSRL